jgi:uncharacterized lipoprotein YmbA
MPNLTHDMTREPATPALAPRRLAPRWLAPRRLATRLLVFAAILSTGGCFSLSRGAPPPQHYVLGTGAATAADRLAAERLAAERVAADRAAAAAAGADRATVAAGPPVVGLRLPRLADYLSTPFIVVRRGDHQVEFTEYHRWGEDLGSAINRTVAGLLAERAPAHRVVTAPWPGGTPPAQVIQLQVLRFEGTAPETPERTTGEGATGQAHLLATWEILRASDGALLARGTTEVREDGWIVGDFGGLVRLLDRGLRRLADDLALNLAAHPAPEPAPSQGPSPGPSPESTPAR